MKYAPEVLAIRLSAAQITRAVALQATCSEANLLNLQTKERSLQAKLDAQCRELTKALETKVRQPVPLKRTSLKACVVTNPPNMSFQSASPNVEFFFAGNNLEGVRILDPKELS